MSDDMDPSGFGDAYPERPYPEPERPGPDYVDELTDAIIEDTVHCKVCGCSYVLGGLDGVISNNRSICIECAKDIHDEYRKACAEAGEEP